MERKLNQFGMLMLSAVILPLVLLGQIQTSSWQDGNPTFTKTYPVMTNLTFDPLKSYVSLATIDSVGSEPANVRFSLNGISWRFPLELYPNDYRISSAEDIELFKSGTIQMYAVVDGGGNKIVVFRLEDNEAINVIKSEAGPLAMKGPSDLDTFSDGVQLKFLVADPGRHRVIKIDYMSKVPTTVFGVDDQIGIGNGRLNNPSDAVKIPGDNAHYLICDRGNKRVVLVNETNKSIIWEWGRQGTGPLNIPEDVEYLAGRHQVLITDRGDNRVIIVDIATNAIVWEYRTGLLDPQDADTLANGNILIADAGHNRLIEVTRSATPILVWKFDQKVASLKDADRIEGIADLRDFNNETLVVMKDTTTSNNNILPIRLGYKSDILTSVPRHLHHQASFDNLFFAGSTVLGTTSVKFKLRSGKSFDGAQQAQWYGPINSSDFYINSGTAINPIHDGDSWYQVQLHLETTSKLHTPEVTSLGVQFHYYQNDEIGVFRSELIGEAPGNVITGWNELKVKTRLPENPAADLNQINLMVNLLSARGDTLVSFTNIRDENNSFPLNGLPGLQDVQLVRIEALFRSTNSAFSPIIDDLSLSWNYKKTEPSKLSFIDTFNDSTTSYRARRNSSDLTADRVILKLVDANVVPLRNKITVPVVSLQSGDRINLELTFDTFLNFYKSPAIAAMVVTEKSQVDTNDVEFQVFDRDILLASYIDPTDPTDTATAQVLMLRNVKGELRVEDATGKAFIDRVRIGDILYAHILGETDHNLSDAQDSIKIEFTNTSNGDYEALWAKEIANSQTSLFNTGEFMTPIGLEIISGLTPKDSSGAIDAVRGHKITVLFDDNDDLVKNLEIPTDTVFVLSGIFDAQVAPNPYYESKHNRLGLRVVSSSGEVTLERLEIFNFAGQRISEIEASNLAFDAAPPFPAGQYATCNNWWNLQTADGEPISSGTYFIKLSGSVRDIATATDRKVDKIVKFVVVR